MLRKFNNMKLQKKLVLSYFFLVLTPILMIAVFSNYHTISSAMRYTAQMEKINFDQMQSNVFDTLESYVRYVDNAAAEYPLVEYLNTEHEPNSIERYTSYRILFDNYAIKFPITSGNFRRLIFYTTNQTVMATDSGFIRVLSEEQRDAPWYYRITSAQGQSTFLEVSHENQQSYINIGKDMQPFGTSAHKNLVLLRIPESELYALIKSESTEREVFVLSATNQIIAASKRYLVGKEAEDIPVLADIMRRLPQDQDFLETKRQHVFYSRWTALTPLYGVRIISIIPQDDIVRELSGSVLPSLAGYTICLVASLLFIAFLSRTITRKLRLLVENVANIQDGNMNLSVAFEGRDEIAELYDSLRDMVQRIDTLIKEVYMLELEKKDAEIMALQSQINPHFVYNTMETIRMNLVKNGDKENAEALRKFANLLQKTINWDSTSVTVYRETELVETYLQLLQYRYYDKFTFTIDIDEDIYHCPIPKFTLQPLVENAITHGIEVKEQPSALHIYGGRKDGRVYITVADNGAGMTEETLRRVRAIVSGREQPSGGTQVGLRNVHRRLTLLYGEEYGISIESEAGKGTQITIQLPEEPTKPQEE